MQRATKAVRAGLLVGIFALAQELPALARQTPRPDESIRTADPERIALGRLSYGIHCASCHGESGRGDGPMTQYLKVPPTDLTRLAVSRKGNFPQTEICAAIDGRREVRGHGPALMPVWGATFQDRGRDMPQEREVRERILDLVAYLESIQTAH